MSAHQHPSLDEEAIRQLVVRLARPSRDGEYVIERAALLAEGADFGAIETWILRHGGRPERPADGVGGGLHADRDASAARRAGAAPARYLLSADAIFS